MSSNRVKTAIDPAVLEEAASHYLKLQDGNISGTELKAWQAWFRRSAAHQQAFKRLETLYGAFDHITLQDDNRLSVKTEYEHFTGAEEARKPTTIMELLAPQKSMPSRQMPKTIRHVVAGIAAMFLAVAITGALWYGYASSGSGAIPYYATDIAEQKVLTLSDGSVVELAVDSAISIHFSNDERRLILERGEAIFTVAKNAQRPFVVEAGKGTVTAIGTVFNVSRRAGNVSVKVLEGTVAVRPTAIIDAPRSVKGGPKHVVQPVPVALVTAGRQTVYTPDGIMKPVEEADVHANLTWRVGVLTMINQRLSTVIGKVNRYLENEISIGDSAVGNYLFTGTVYPDKIDDWLQGLQKGYPIKVVRLGSSTVLMHDDTLPSDSDG